MKKIFYFILFTIIISSASCGDPFPGGPIITECTWTNNVTFVFNSVKLSFPYGKTFYNVWGMNEFTDFLFLFNTRTDGIKQSNIAITTTVEGCIGTTSKSVIYVDEKNDDILGNGFRNQYKEAYASLSSHTTKIEITAGPYKDSSTGNIGLIIWSQTKSLAEFAAASGTPANFHLLGTFKSSQLNSPIRIFLNGEFVEVEPV